MLQPPVAEGTAAAHRTADDMASGTAGNTGDRGDMVAADDTADMAADDTADMAAADDTGDMALDTVESPPVRLLMQCKARRQTRLPRPTVPRCTAQDPGMAVVHADRAVEVYGRVAGRSGKVAVRFGTVTGLVPDTVPEALPLVARKADKARRQTRLPRPTALRCTAQAPGRAVVVHADRAVGRSGMAGA